MLSDLSERVDQGAPQESNPQASARPNARDEAAELRASGLFDDAWYLTAYPDVAAAGIDPLAHFCRFGWIEHRQPNPWFDTAWYLEQNPGKNANPLLQYVRRGEADGRRPSRLFDPAWYRIAHDLPADAPPLRHFLAHRHSGQFAPDPSLYAVPYLRPYAATSRDPYLHYLRDMEQQGQPPFPDLEIVTASGLLDPNYYLINGSDVQEAQLDPALHFCRHGWKERRNPNLYFHTGWYLRTNPTVARLGINPLVHYVLLGEAANRRPVVHFDPGWYRATYTVEPARTALRHFLDHRHSQTVSPTPLFDVTWYIGRQSLRQNRDPFAHYLHAGMCNDIDPSPAFDAKTYRANRMGRSASGLRGSLQAAFDHPLIHHLDAEYRRRIPGQP